jgi:2-polyprenyl-3-methyl-5-hydroxy-6-metoxy-1,4-benzoquinol methylase
MKEIKEITNILCPVCGCEMEPVLRCRDYRVTDEMFDLLQCRGCSFGMTSPQPDPNDIGRYYQTEDYVSHSETTRGIINKLYRVVRTKNTKDKLRIVNSLSSARGDLLDVGCGTGYFLSVCRRDGWQVEGVELNEMARITATSRIDRPVYPSIDAVESTGKQFDIITLWHVFEHLYDINVSLLQLRRLLRPEGTLILALPNPASADADYYREYWAAYDVPRHLSHFSPPSIAALTKNHGMKIKDIIPMKFDAFYVSMMSEELKGRGKLSALLRGFVQGFRSNRFARKTGNYSSMIWVIHLTVS